jgi:hypothetical protein
VERITLFEREVRERLSRSALALLFAGVEVIAEGQRSHRGGKEVFFGSTMLTLDLSKVAGAVRDACDARCAQRIATLLGQDADARATIEAIAARETERLAGARPTSLVTEVKVRARGAIVHVDVDVEATL